MAERRKLTLWAGISQYSQKHLVLATGGNNTGASASSSLPASVFLLFSDFLHTQDDKESFAKFSFLIHAQFEGLSGAPHFLDR